MRVRHAPIVVAVTVAVGCGDGDGGPRVSSPVQRSLPTHQFGLAEDVCPEHLGMPPAEARRTRRTGRRQLAALLAAYRRDPEAVVRSSYTPAHEPGIGHEDVTVRDLAEGHLETAEELTSDGAVDRRCVGGVVDQLRAALDAD